MGTESCLSYSPDHQVSLSPFSGPGQDAGPLPNACTFLAFLQSLSSCCRAFSPMLIYSLLFLKYTQRPLAQHTRHRHSIQPKHQVHTNQALWDLGQASRNDRPGVKLSSQKRRPKIPLAPSPWSPEMFSGLQRLGCV